MMGDQGMSSVPSSCHSFIVPPTAIVLRRSLTLVWGSGLKLPDMSCHFILNDLVDFHSPSDFTFSFQYYNSFSLMTSFSSSFSFVLSTLLSVSLLAFFLIIHIYSTFGYLWWCGSSKRTFALTLLECNAQWWKIAYWNFTLILICPCFWNVSCWCLHRQPVHSISISPFVQLLHILMQQIGDVKHPLFFPSPPFYLLYF